ncbi:glycoside hydrolase family 32 protein [uncultured Cedecea sp.]|uniref:glycoside hydrolase family 32 protein n=1 Tax=uncultured Cedecea sp. TaxID=988762 RepID=UPI002626F844|nr:glycoside hydrolase family 32 protein [uncultured Cedecea sp.]
MTSLLQQADAAVEINKLQVNKKWYPKFHIAAQTGWINDPNGLVWFDGWYHAFYQFHPYSTHWGPMHWGHVRSKDLVHWEPLPVALAPEGPEDKDGCFSGSAVVDGDTLALIYTGHKFAGDSREDDALYQVQCMARSKDGITFERKGIIIDTPPGLHHFRDPKVWREGDSWYMVVGARVGDCGQVRLYRSDDLYQWQDEGILAQSEPGMGYMWECPDFFKLGDKYVLMFSPQGIEANGYHHRNLFQSGYLIGDWAPGQPFVHNNDFKEMDHGHDFYAPQSLQSPDGRRIVLGWLNMWESAMPEQQDGWSGLLTVPREITLGENNKLLSKPVPELAALRTRHCHHGITELASEKKEIPFECDAFELQLAWDTAASTAEKYGISPVQGLSIYIDNQAKRLFLERAYPEFNMEGERSIPLPDSDILSLQIFIDRSSVEIFVNEGEACLSSRIYPAEEQKEIIVFAHHGRALLTRFEYWDIQ